MVELTKKTFEEQVLMSKIPVMILFYRKDDAECTKLMESAERIADKMQDKAKICKVDVDQEIALALNYQVMDLPLVVFMNYGIFQERIQGNTEEEILLEKLQKLCDCQGTQQIHF